MNDRWLCSLFSKLSTNDHSDDVVPSDVTDKLMSSSSIVFRIKKSIKKIGFFANIETSKGIFCFLDMAKIYYDNNIEVEFIVAGEFR